MGECPEWYALFAAAEKCNCKVWELPDVPIFWLNKALIAVTAENQAMKNIQRRNERK
jgi:hypothetical protein